MKKLITLSLVLFIAVQFTSCKKSKETTEENKVALNKYTIDTKNVDVHWTAYKTTDKLPVKGVFQEVKLSNNNASENQAGVLNGLKFEIPVASIFSKDSIRDGKLKQFFFGVMENTVNLTGTLNNVANGSGNVDLNMNGITKNLPFTFEISGDTIAIKSTIQLDNWNGATALASLNEACKELHTGADGVTKTWNEVDVKVNVLTKKD